MSDERPREGSLEAPTRHSIEWQTDEFYAEEPLFEELERVFDICHGCRRCFSLCESFPTLFDAIDESDTMELDGVERKVYWDVVDHCYLCDMCFMAKCPYVPPHEWNIDFPHLMLRAKAKRFKDEGTSLRNRILASPREVGNIAGIPVVAGAVNAINRSGAGRTLLEATLGVAKSAPVPEYHSRTARRRLSAHVERADAAPHPNPGRTQGRVVLFTTCYGDRNRPDIVEDMAAVYTHNDIPVTLLKSEACCGMPRLELGDLEAVDEARRKNIPALLERVEQGWDIITPVPSCTLMFRQELPLMYPDDEDVQRVAAAVYDPFEYLWVLHRESSLSTEFSNPLGKVAYQVPCHLRVQNIGLKTRDVLALVPDTEIEVIERCSGHDGTYGVKTEFRAHSEKIARPVISRAEKADPDFLMSDCPMAADQVANGMQNPDVKAHPMSLLRRAYGI